MERLALGAAAITLFLAVPQNTLAHDLEDLSPTAKGEVETITALIKGHPRVAIDFRDVSNEYCFNTKKAGGHSMTHYAFNPAATQEDVVEFVDARPLIDSGLDVTTLQSMPGALGQMKPGQWYYLKPGAFEPHHGTTFSRPMIIRANNLGE